MSVVAEGTVSIKENPAGKITSVCWAINPWPVSGAQPMAVSYLRYAHGERSPQALIMALGGDEVMTFWKAEDEIADRVHLFLKHSGKLTIMAVDLDDSSPPAPVRHEWEVSVSVFHDYTDTLAEV